MERSTKKPTSQEAFRKDRAERVRAILDSSHEAGRRNGHMGHCADDVQRLVREMRQEQKREENAR